MRTSLADPQSLGGYPAVKTCIGAPPWHKANLLPNFDAYERHSYFAIVAYSSIKGIHLKRRHDRKVVKDGCLNKKLDLSDLGLQPAANLCAPGNVLCRIQLSGGKLRCNPKAHAGAAVDVHD